MTAGEDGMIVDLQYEHLLRTARDYIGLSVALIGWDQIASGSSRFQLPSKRSDYVLDLDDRISIIEFW